MEYSLINSNILKLWTIQPESIYETLLEKGELSAFGSTLANSDPKHLFGYEWLIEQMTLRLGQSKLPNQYPFWAWFQWNNFNQQKPDLKNYGLEKGEKHVLLSLEIPRDDVLLSDYDRWHNVFDDQIPVIKDHQFFENIPLDDLPLLGYGDKKFFDLPEKYQNIIKDTWPNIFDLNIQTSWHTKRIQATFWMLKLSQVTDVEFYTEF